MSKRTINRIKDRKEKFEAIQYWKSYKRKRRAIWGDLLDAPLESFTDPMLKLLLQDSARRLSNRTCLYESGENNTISGKNCIIHYNPAPDTFEDAIPMRCGGNENE